MTVVGSAWVEILAQGDKFGSSLSQSTTPGLRQFQTQAEGTAASGSRAFRLMANTARDSTSGALTPILGLFDHIGNVIDDLKAKSIGLKTTALGAAGVGVGAGLLAFGSKEQASQQQLRSSIENTGNIWEDYSKQVSNAVGTGERYGLLAYKTMDVLNRLTIATHSPTKALHDLQLVLDISAARHISAASAAQILGSAYAGNTRVFKIFGINITDQRKELAAVTKAQDAHTKAVQAVKKAEQGLADDNARISASLGKRKDNTASLASAEAAVASATASLQSSEFKHGAQSLATAAAQARLTAAEARLTSVRESGNKTTTLSVSQEITLRNAHEKVKEAERNLRDTTNKLADAHKGAAGAAHTQDQALDQLRRRVSGQGAAAIDTYSGKLSHLTAVIEDQVSAFGLKYGPAVTSISTGLLALGTGISGASTLFGRFNAQGRLAAQTQNLFAESSAARVAANDAVTAANLTLIQSEQLVTETELLTGEQITLSAEQIQAAAQTSTVALEELGIGARAASSQAVAGFGSMAAASESQLKGRMTGAIGAVVGAIGAFEIGKATAGHGTGGAVAGTLGGAVAGAVAGFSVGGPFGAAIGGAGGALIGLIGHFHNTAKAIDGTTKSVTAYTTALTSALEQDKNVAGGSTKAFIQQFLQKNPKVTAQFAAQGLTLNDIVQFISKGSSSPAATKLSAKAQGGFGANGPIINQGAQVALQQLDDLKQAWSKAHDAAANYLAVTKDVPAHNKRVADSANSAAGAVNRENAALAGVPSAVSTQVTIHYSADFQNKLTAATLAKLTRLGGSLDGLTPAHRALGGDVRAGMSYIVGERRPELFTPSVNGSIASSVPGMAGTSTGGDTLAAITLQHAYLNDIRHLLTQLVGVEKRAPIELASHLRRNDSSRFLSPELRG